MTFIYWIIFVAFITTIVYLINSLILNYKEQFILTNASEKISDGYLIFSANGKITNYNQTFLNHFNFKRKDVNNKSIFQIFSNKLFDNKDINRIIDSCKQIKNSNEKINLDLRTVDGKKIFKIEVKSIVNNDIFLRYVMVCKDITNTYEIIEELQNNQDMLANREKFAILGQLISRNSTFIKISYFCTFNECRKY